MSHNLKDHPGSSGHLSGIISLKLMPPAQVVFHWCSSRNVYPTLSVVEKGMVLVSGAVNLLE